MTDERNLTRDERIWKEYLLGASQAELGRRHGISQQRVSVIIADMRDALPARTREELVAESVELLRELRQTVAGVMEDAYDPKVTLDAVGTHLRIMEREARLLGLDAATKLEHTVSGEERAAAEALGQEAARRLAGEAS